MKDAILCLFVVALLSGIAQSGGLYESMSDEELMRELVDKLKSNADADKHVARLNELLDKHDQVHKKNSKETFLEDVVQVGKRTSKDLGAGTLSCPEGNIGSFPPQGAIIYPAINRETLDADRQRRNYYFRRSEGLRTKRSSRRSSREDEAGTDDGDAASAVDAGLVMTTKCSHAISVDATYVKLIVTLANSKGGQNCSLSQLTLHEGDDGSAEPFLKVCGSSPPIAKVCPGNKVYVDFATANTDAEAGFTLFWIGGE
jgi:hypothetical protein